MTPLSPYDPEVETLWRAIDAANARSVAVVCSKAGEGTTMIASALARRAGLGGKPALLVDLNSGRPGVARLLGLHPEPGQIVNLPALGLGVLAALRPEDAEAWRNPAALAGQAARWEADWGLVVFDTAPIISLDQEPVPATAVASAAECAVLVTLAGRTSVTTIREARARLAGAGANLIGTVLNDRDNPSLLTELEREAHRFGRYMPGRLAWVRNRLRRAPLLSVRV